MNDLGTIEAVRKDRLKKFYILLSISGGMLLLAIIFGLIYYLGNPVDIIFMLLVVCVLLFIVFMILAFVVPNSGYNRYVKDNLEKAIMDSIFAKDGNKYTYNERNGIAFREMNYSGVMNAPDEFSSSDTVRSSYKGVEFVLSDYIFTIIKETTDSKGNHHESRYPYPGRYMCFNLERNFECGLSIIEKKNNPEVFKSGLYKEKVEFESIDFNKKFYCTSSDREKAFYLIRPKEIMNLLDLERLYRGNIVNILVNHTIYFFLADTSIEFNFSIFKKIDDNLINDIKAYYLLPLKIIDTLKLDADKYNNKEL